MRTFAVVLLLFPAVLPVFGQTIDSKPAPKEATPTVQGIYPHGNWIGVENASSEPAMILFFFNKPAFEQCLRALSSRPGEKFTMPTPDKMATVEHECHQVMK